MDSEFAALLAMSSLMATESYGKDIVLGHSTAGLAATYNAAVARGFEQKTKELGATAVILDSKWSLETQGNGLDDLIVKKVDGIMINPLDSVLALAWVDKTAAAGIPIIASSNRVGDPTKVALENVPKNLTALIIPNDIDAGINIGQAAANMLPKDKKAKIAIAEGAAGVLVVQERTKGFEQGLKKAGADYTIVASQPTNWTSEEGQSVCQNMLTANPDIDLIYAHYDDIAVGCSKAIQAAGSKAKLVSAAGGGQLGDQAIREGHLDASICTKPLEIGQISAQMLYDAATGKNTKKAQLVLMELAGHHRHEPQGSVSERVVSGRRQAAQDC